MRIKIDNIAKIKSADVRLNGLTVIAGENGSGKSTVGKMLFSVVQVLKSTQVNNAQKQTNLLKKHVQALYTRLNGIRRFSRPNDVNALPWSYSLPTQLLDGTLTVDQFKAKVRSALGASENVTPRTKACIERDLNNIELCVLNSDNRAAVQASSIQSMIESEFMNSVCSIDSLESGVMFDTEDASGANIFFEIKGNEVLSVNSSGYEFLQDATYVESPLYLHMLESLSRSIQYVEVEKQPIMRGRIPTHIKDFVEKMAFAKSAISNTNDYPDILKNIEEIINGSFQFDSHSGRVYYMSHNNSFSPINTASGTKTFGVMQLLLQSNLVGPDRILIWDEPENHLHPQWQIAFADILIQLVLQGSPILISTHSPYFIQAIRYFSAKYGAESNVDYYFAEEQDDGLSVLSDVTHDLNKVFTRLSNPLKEVMDVDRVRKK